MTKNEWLSVSKVSDKVGIPVETIRRYIRLYSMYLNVKRIHKRYLVHDDCVTVLQQIRELYANGKNIEEIRDTLLNREIPFMMGTQNISHERMIDSNKVLELKQLHSNDKNVEEVKKTLLNNGNPTTVDRQSISHERMTDKILTLKRMFDEQKRINEQQEAFNKFLLEKLSQQEENDRKRLKKFDEALKIFEKEKESLIEIAAGRQRKSKRKGAFLNLF